jgi:hypothetical protein
MPQRRKTTLTAEQLRTLVARLPAILAGYVPAYQDVSEGFQLRVAVAFLERVKLAFLTKARGGVGDDGISWPPLTERYLAYGRGPFSTRRAGKNAPGTVRGGERDGQQKDGFMTKAQLKRWRKVYGAALSRTVLIAPLQEAKGLAAAIAWNDAKASGVKTKLQVFGSRQVDILRDRGELFNSLSPGIIVALPNGSASRSAVPPGQIVLHSPGRMIVGTNVKHADYHHNAKRASRLRKLWPQDLPSAWAEYITKQSRKGVIAVVEYLLRAA